MVNIKSEKNNKKIPKVMVHIKMLNRKGYVFELNKNTYLASQPSRWNERL